nr:uncharacterized protein LOC123758657 [Procambarus clarkii]
MKLNKCLVIISVKWPVIGDWIPIIVNGQPVYRNGQPAVDDGRPVTNNIQDVSGDGIPVYYDGQPAHDGEQPAHDGGQPAHDGGQPAHDGGQPAHDGGQPAHDGGQPAHDGGQPAHDGGQPAHDGGQPAHDGGQPAHDGGQPAHDGGQPAHDGGQPAHDGGQPAHDGGQPAHDGGQPAHDGGQPAHDGGQPAHDGGQPAHDGGQPAHDGGQPAHDGGQPACCDGQLTKNRQPARTEGRHWHLYLGVVLLFGMAGADQTTTDVHNLSSGRMNPGDCIVHQLVHTEASPRYYFKDEMLTLSFLPQAPTDQVLSGINFTVYKNNREAILTAMVPELNSSAMGCFSNGKLSESITVEKFENLKHFEWVHIDMSIKNKSLIINGNYTVCPSTAVEEPLYMVVTVTQSRSPINLVTNCQHACPVFLNSSLAAYNKSIISVSKQVYVANTSVEAMANLSLVQCMHTCAGSTVKNITDISMNASSINSSKWEELILKNDNATHTLSIGHFEEMVKKELKEVELRLTSARSMAWTVGCDPRTNGSTWNLYKRFINQKMSDNSSSKSIWWILLIVFLVIMIFLGLSYYLLKMSNVRKQRKSGARTSVSFSALTTSENITCTETPSSSGCSPSTQVPERRPPLPSPPGCSPLAEVPQRRPPQPSPLECSPPRPPGAEVPQRRPPQPPPITATLDSEYAEIIEENEEEHLYSYVDLEALKKQLVEEKMTKKQKESMKNEVNRANEENEEERDTKDLSRHDSENSLYRM